MGTWLTVTDGRSTLRTARLLEAFIWAKARLREGAARVIVKNEKGEVLHSWSWFKR